MPRCGVGVLLENEAGEMEAAFASPGVWSSLSRDDTRGSKESLVKEQSSLWTGVLDPDQVVVVLVVAVGVPLGPGDRCELA